MSTKLEQGNIYFFYQPKVEESEPVGPEDIQRLYMVLSPHGEHLFRLILIARKRLPKTVESGHDKLWGFVDTVTDDAKDMRDELLEETYETKTRGERTRPAARPSGEGVYAIVEHETHTHLAYVLELPKEPDDVQEDLQIEDEASYVISVKNPDAPSPKGVGLESNKKAEYPAELHALFGKRRFAPVDPPEFLNYEGGELLFIAASGNVIKDLNVTLPSQDETLDTAEIVHELKILKSKQPVTPLLEGEWT